ncbi:MAG: SAM-dependent methyltransferase [Streptosporangiaceae bacterium]
MSGTEQSPGTNTSVPSVARIYDWLLGGTNNYEVDRELGEAMTARAPELRDAARANRSFHQRAARYLAEHGIRQFIDLGSGLPTAGNTHEIVFAARSDARVVYVDIDPLVLSHSQYQLAGDDRVAAVVADIRDVAAVLGAAGAGPLIDLGQPVAILMTGLLHLVPDAEDPAGLVARYMSAVAPGSYLVISHMTADQKPPKGAEAVRSVGSQSGSGWFPRSKDELRQIIGDLDIIPPYAGAGPEVTWVGLWQCVDRKAADSDGSRWLYCAVARKPD